MPGESTLAVAMVDDMVQRLTKPTARVLAQLLKAEHGRAYGMELSNTADVGPGTLYPMLARLESIGWVDSYWEDIDPSEANRPARRYYTLTSQGRIDAAAAIDRRHTLGEEGLAQA